MKSKNPKLFMNKGAEPAFAKFQPSKSLIFEKLPTIREITQKHEHDIDIKPNTVSDSPSANGSPL